MIICAVAVQFIAPFLGHATITKVLRYLSYVFIVVFIVMAILVIPHAHLTSLHQHTSWWLWTTGLVLIVSAGGLGLDRERRRLLPLPPPGHAQGRRPSGPRRSEGRSRRSCSSSSEQLPIS